jgi:hypothetical protein
VFVQIIFTNIGGINASLRLLSLEGNTIGNALLATTTTTSTAATAGTICSCALPHLETLSLECVGASQEGLKKLLESIRHHPNLQCLNLMGNAVDQSSTLDFLCSLLENDGARLQRVLRDKPTCSGISGSTGSVAMQQANGL